MSASLALPAFHAERLAHIALAEDLGAGDVTTDACVLPDTRAVARARARTDLVASGLELAVATFRLVDPTIEVEVIHSNGELVRAGEELFVARGNARALLNGERVALN
ncbi:MAG: nicotinate-nucleotide diphosphorylase (carboxylating), partial [Proteobacteria bacterium]